MLLNNLANGKGGFGIESEASIVSIIAFRPILETLHSALLINAACHDNQSDVLLGNHSPEVANSVLLRALTGDYGPISNSSQRPINKVRIDVGCNFGLNFIKSRAWKQMDS